MYYSHNDNNKNRCMNMEYAKAYVLLQKYENLINIKYVFDKGTIFKDLVCPYKESKQY